MTLALVGCQDEIEVIERSRLVMEAQTWVGTRYVDHGEIKGVGADCAGFIKGALVNVGLIVNYDVGYYSPQQWLRRNFEDRTYLQHVLAICKEITSSPLPGDIVLYKMARSFTHGALVVRWPDYVLHSITTNGVCGAHGSNEGFLKNRDRRYFRLKRWSA